MINWLCAGMLTVIMALFVSASIKDDKILVAAKNDTKTCYTLGMVKVYTEVGTYCVAPSNLVEIK